MKILKKITLTICEWIGWITVAVTCCVIGLVLSPVVGGMALYNWAQSKQKESGK